MERARLPSHDVSKRVLRQCEVFDHVGKVLRTSLSIRSRSDRLLPPELAEHYSYDLHHLQILQQHCQRHSNFGEGFEPNDQHVQKFHQLQRN